MSQNFLIEVMYVWAIGNFIACLLLVLFGFKVSLRYLQYRERSLKVSLGLNMFVCLLICNGFLTPFLLWLLMIINLGVAVVCLKITDFRYENWLKTRKFAFKPERIKHNIVHGRVEIDGKRYYAFIPPVWVKEYQDEKGNMIPGTYKSYHLNGEQKVRFKRFVSDYGGRLIVELG